MKKAGGYFLFNIADLFSVKSIITLAAFGLFCFLVLVERIGTDTFMYVFLPMVGYFFRDKILGKQEADESNAEDEREENHVKPDEF